MKKIPCFANILTSTFLHFNSIGKIKEYDFWRNGITSWDDLQRYLEGYQLSLFNDNYKNPLLQEIDASRKALLEKDSDYFSSKLPSREYYRIVLSFYEKTLFLDIETTGLSKYYDYITLIGWSYKGKYHYLIKGDNDNLLRKHLSDAKCIVTFNGSIFDIPFLKQEIKDLKIPQTHVDLRFLSKRVGLHGGQKEIERQINIKRPKGIEEIDGKAATILWYKYRQGDLKSLKSLIKYNYRDVLGMEIIFDEIIKRLLKINPFPLNNKPVYQFRKNKNIPGFSLEVPKELWKNKIDYLNNSSKSITINDIKKDDVKLKIVGIDLTGSESRATGCCFINDNWAQTKLINSDAEIIEYTIRKNPHIVSIDSPLSLPTGRISVSDDDPGRDIYGIMRRCERILKKRGINVYPSLIPSMQKLTERGIKLANKFRSMGVPVIESFPGAAQDIMKIPRKRSDIKMLKEGLIRFGIKGDYQINDISHDELDAITSAIVGIFFWYGKFEALGNMDEEFLIIPDSNIDNTFWKNKTIIGLSGPIATGKTTAGAFLESKGFYYTRFSLILEKLLIEKGETVNRENLQKIGLEFKKGGQRNFCKLLYNELPDKGNIVIDGLRHPEDHVFFTEFFGPHFIHIYIDTPLQLRNERYIKLGKSAEDFHKSVQHEVEGNVDKLLYLSHFTIKNEKGIKDLESTIDNTLKSIQK
ncbi:MAG: ribonuclease H-like domain-containing protein [Candidatus Latescibacteria bacterium]|nr:ribonuclease H-like domain-containing protein [Candidatus Latescibacterota bacterium]